jgi:hypothetical protein
MKFFACVSSLERKFQSRAVERGEPAVAAAVVVGLEGDVETSRVQEAAFRVQGTDFGFGNGRAHGVALGTGLRS